MGLMLRTGGVSMKSVANDDGDDGSESMGVFMGS
jgi:hypothetical protein